MLKEVDLTNKRLFVVVPSFRPSGPIKGAVALCNGLVNHMAVTLVVLKREVGEESLFIDPRVKILSLVDLNWKNKITSYREVLSGAGGKVRVTSLSMCFHADFLNFFMASYATIISSVRGNLIRIYWFEYGSKGFLAAVLHITLLHRFDHVVAMSQAMANQLKRYGLRRISIIRNFIDELNLEKFRKMHDINEENVRFIFIGSLSVRKRPELLLDAIRELHNMGNVCCLDFVGDGQLREKLISKTKALELEKWVAS
jgi:glycosyltransferase involved in cell wall biosynthesis